LTGLLLLLFIPSFQTNYIQFEIGKRLSLKTKIWKDTKTDPITSRDIIGLRNDVIGEMVQEGKLTKTEGNVLYRTASYSSDFKTGSARTAMWQSAIGLSVKNLKDPNFKAWIKEYPLLGTGPGTIKAFFPKFRRPDYGRLEGGHNFTPDKLHNDYLDTIATHGLIGFAVYFVLFIPLCGYLAIKHISEHPGHPANLLIVGLSAGVIVYLGQTMFNFGVVATKVLYYELLALAVALVLNHKNLFDQNG
jgi:O-antigen ligase